MTRLSIAALSAVFVLAAGAASAHHGWTTYSDQEGQVVGVVEAAELGAPHGVLKVRAADGLWDVDLAPLARSVRAGFDENAAKIGDEVTCIGFRARDHAQRRMKAARVIVGGATYDVYPDRVPSI